MADMPPEQARFKGPADKWCGDESGIEEVVRSLEQVDADRLDGSSKEKLKTQVVKAFDGVKRMRVTPEERMHAWNRLLLMLRKLDAKAYDERRSVLLGEVKVTLGKYDELWNQLEDMYRGTSRRWKASLEILNFQYCKLYELLGYQTAVPEAAQVVEERIAETEREMAVHKNKFAPFVKELIEDTEDLRRFARTAEETRVLDSLVVASGTVQKKSDKYVVKSRGKRWQVEFFAEISEGPLLAVVSEKEPRKFGIVPYGELTEKLESDGFGEITAEIEKNFKEEAAGREELSQYDLSRDEPIAYLRLFPKTYDSVVGVNLQMANILISVLEEKYPKMHSMPILFADAPKRELEQAIGAEYAKGVRYFCLEIYSHGSKEKLKFGKGLTARDLASLVRKFPKGRFHVSSAACYGGGLRKGLLVEMEKDTSLKSRLNVFLQTKPNGPNMLGKLKSGLRFSPFEVNDNFSTYYYLFLIDALQKGKSYGEAAVEADRKAKQRTYIDAEAIVNGLLITELKHEDGTRRAA